MSEEYIDLNLHAGEPEQILDNLITNPLQLFFQEIELAVKINLGEIWGINTSINLKKYLFNRYITINQIKEEITTFISRNCQHASEFIHTCDVEFLKIDNKDLVYILVKIYDTENNSEFINKFLVG